VNRAFLWVNMVLATLVVIGVFVQVYLIGSYIFGAGTDALDAHEHSGDVIHLIEVLVFLSAIPAFWRRWPEIGWSLALGILGTIQVGLANGDDWVGGLHAFFALIVFVLAAVITHRDMRFLGLGRHAAPGAAR
jgi:hypothetical protein